MRCSDGWNWSRRREHSKTKCIRGGPQRWRRRPVSTRRTWSVSVHDGLLNYLFFVIYFTNFPFFMLTNSPKINFTPIFSDCSGIPMWRTITLMDISTWKNLIIWWESPWSGFPGIWSWRMGTSDRGGEIPLWSERSTPLDWCCRRIGQRQGIVWSRWQKMVILANSRILLNQDI